MPQGHGATLQAVAAQPRVRTPITPECVVAGVVPGSSLLRVELHVTSFALASGTTQLRRKPRDPSFSFETSPVSSQADLLDNVHFSALRPQTPIFLLFVPTARLALAFGVETRGTNIGHIVCTKKKDTATPSHKLTK